jgi:thiamine transport system substrate-binding protein
MPHLIPASGTLRAWVALVFLLSSGAWLTSGAQAASPDIVSAYTYDSFMAKGGLGPAIIPAFEKKCGCKFKALPSGDGAQLFARVELDAQRKKPGAELVIGIDQLVWARMKAADLVDLPAVPLVVEPVGEASVQPGPAPSASPLSVAPVAPVASPSPAASVLPDSWKPAIEVQTQLDPHAKVEPGFFSYDYGVLTFMADRELLKGAPPRHLDDLRDPRWRRQFILEDPRTSTPGLQFVLFASQVLGAGAAEFWTALRGQWLALPPGWDSAYGMFLKGEAPLVWSYTTSQAYHQAHGDSARYQAIVLDDGNPAQIEGAAIVKGAVQSPRQLELVHEFLDYLQSPEVQAQVPSTNWMFPARSGTPLPPSFAGLPAPKAVVRTQVSGDFVTAALANWTHAVSGKQK